MQVKILTFVTNFGGKGPGHSAVSVGSMIYTFEDTGGWFDPGSGWKKLNYSSYLTDNQHRPILIQTIPSAKYNLVTEYVDKSIKNDDDYGGSGVCSQQVAQAINYALPRNIDFDPFGFDTPKTVYYCARQMGLVSSEEYLWPGKSTINFLVYGNIINNLVMDYPNVLRSMDVSR